MSSTPQNPSNTQMNASRHEQLTASTYKNNCASNYTEIIEQLDRDFTYEENKDSYWGPQELSLFYGTNLFKQASETQKLALNHLYWVTQYNQTAATEANAILYNQVTEGVFSALGDCTLLCKELSLETDQEHHHIHAFHSVGYKTKKALFNNPKYRQPKARTTHSKPKPGRAKYSLSMPTLDWERLREDAYRLLSIRLSSGGGGKAYSEYLKLLQQNGKHLPVQKAGLLGQVVPSSLSKFLTINFGSSPFSACFFYATRYKANMILKNYEYRYLQYYKQLNQNSKAIPAPTSISYYHMLDESFHTTTSQLISQDLYKQFNKPTLYESLMANIIFYRSQQLMLSGISSVLPATFRNDGHFLMPLYQILRSPIFELEHEEAMEQLEQALCTEHEGYHMNLQHHQRLITTMQQAFQPMNYLWKVNKNLEIMDEGKSIEKNRETNRQAFIKFKESSSDLKKSKMNIG
jgi:hypothetical protein